MSCAASASYFRNDLSPNDTRDTAPVSRVFVRRLLADLRDGPARGIRRGHAVPQEDDLLGIRGGASDARARSVADATRAVRPRWIEPVGIVVLPSPVVSGTVCVLPVRQNGSDARCAVQPLVDAACLRRVATDVHADVARPPDPAR